MKPMHVQIGPAAKMAAAQPTATPTYRWGLVRLQDGAPAGKLLWFKTRKQAYECGVFSCWVQFAVLQRYGR